MARSKEPKPGKRLSDFLKEKAAQPLPVYVLVGTDPFLMDKGRQAVRKQVIADADPGMAVMECLGSDAQLADVLDALRTLPFLAPRRLVLIRESDDFVSEYRAALEKYLAEPSSCGSLVLESASWNASTNLGKRVAEIGLLIRCEADDLHLIPPWLCKQAFKEYGKTLTGPAAQMLYEYLGADFAMLTKALEMLALYAGASPRIDTAEVDALIVRGHHERVWDLCDAVAEGRVARALELLDSFWNEGMAAPQIVGVLRPTFRQLIRVQALAVGRRMGLDAAMNEAKVPFFGPVRDRIKRATRALSEADLARAYQALVDADLEAKTTPNDRLAMETLIHRLANPAASRAAGGL